jgi:hypothetical protein
MKRSRPQEIFHAVCDKRLYGFGSFFFLSGPLLAAGFATQVLIYLALNRLMLYIYAPLFIMLVFFSGLGSKNFALEVHNMGRFRAFLFLLASVLASTLPFTLAQPTDPLYGLYRFFLLFAISSLALTIAITEVTIWGQRVSLREKMGLADVFFTKQKKVWEKKLADFPNLEDILISIDSGRFIATLFDRGSFNLAVLWSCNLMEQIIDAVAAVIISRNPQRMELFKKEDGSPVRYPKQLKSLGFKPNIEKNRKDEQITTEALWHEIRNDIAHRNDKPTFQQTSGTICILVSFMEEMPEILEAWK